MNSILDFPDRFRDCLLAVQVSCPQVRVFEADSGKYKYYGKLVSPDFEGMNEGQRQRLVFDTILERMSDFDQRRIAFIFTDAPSEVHQTQSTPPPAAAPAPAQT